MRITVIMLQCHWQRMEIKMGIKRIIDGKAYNTETASLVHEHSARDDTVYHGLYQTKHGAFFEWAYDSNWGNGDVKPLSDDEARSWLEKFRAPTDVIERYCGPFPEGGASETRITLRLPGNLYNRLTAAASAVDVSLNTYVMRQLERLN